MGIISTYQFFFIFSHSSAMEASKSAKLYQHKTEGVQKKYGIQLLEYLPVKKGDIIGEIGCGSGNFAAILARLVSCYKFIFSIKALDKK